MGETTGGARHEHAATPYGTRSDAAERRADDPVGPAVLPGFTGAI
jgi:hypothetical protein